MSCFCFRGARRASAAAAVLLAATWAPGRVPAQGAESAPKQASVFFPAARLAQARNSARQDPWAVSVRDALVAAAEPWMKLSDDRLWEMMFGNTIKRSWMVWSNGYCPACRKSVPMYEWRPEALARPWKMRCPHCKELFPKNDFEEFYRSGLSEQGVFEPGRADRSLLVNAEHAGAADPLRSFGVDDGEGYVADGKRWRFIGAYLIYGQWKQAIVGGIRNLAAAHVVTGEAAYAHKAGVMLDRVADLYPTFDFRREGVLYEGPGAAGYVSTWHDAAVEVRELAIAYDAVFEALARDESLVQFLADKAQQHKLANPKASFAAVQQNIEERILRDTLNNRPKIESNYPSTDMTVTIINAVLGWPRDRERVTAMIDAMIQRATAVDGLTGEKGLAGYSTIAPRGVAELLGWFSRADPAFLKEALKRHPQLHAMYRFHLDTWCLGHYYPQCGDTGSFAARFDGYVGLTFTRNPGIGPSSYSFLWDLYEATRDADFVRLLYATNGKSEKGLPYDWFVANPADFQQRVHKAVAEAGPAIQTASVNKQKWCLAVLRSGAGSDQRAMWLDYDSGGGHGHADGMNLGLFAKGLDLLPDFGYPPVQYGGWGSPRSTWYMQSAAHNTVVVDGQNSRAGSGTTTLWADGKQLRAIRASGPQLVAGKQFERTAVLIDVSDADCYVVDLFRVAGGTEHVKFVHSSFGRIAPQGLSLKPCEEYGRGAQMRSFRHDPQPATGWSVDWTIEDHFQYLSPGRQVHLRYTDLTSSAEAILAEGWVNAGLYDESAETWIPRVLVRRRAPAGPLASTFVSVIEPYEKQTKIAAIRRLTLETADGTPCPEGHVALELRLADGRRDVLMAADVEDPLGPPAAQPQRGVLVQKETGLRLEGELALVRFDPAGKPCRIVLCRGKSLDIGGTVIRTKRPADCIEVLFSDGRPQIVTGSPDDVESASSSSRKPPG